MNAPLHIASFNFKLNTCNIIYTKLNLLFNSLYKHALQLVILVVDSLLSLNERHAYCSDLNGNLFDDISKCHALNDECFPSKIQFINLFTSNLNRPLIVQVGYICKILAYKKIQEDIVSYYSVVLEKTA